MINVNKIGKTPAKIPFCGSSINWISYWLPICTTLFCAPVGVDCNYVYLLKIVTSCYIVAISCMCVTCYLQNISCTYSKSWIPLSYGSSNTFWFFLFMQIFICSVFMSSTYTTNWLVVFFFFIEKFKLIQKPFKTYLSRRE